MLEEIVISEVLNCIFVDQMDTESRMQAFQEPRNNFGSADDSLRDGIDRHADQTAPTVSFIFRVSFRDADVW